MRTGKLVAEGLLSRVTVTVAVAVAAAATAASAEASEVLRDAARFSLSLARMLSTPVEAARPITAAKRTAIAQERRNTTREQPRIF